jgi:hypothetical protein
MSRSALSATCSAPQRNVVLVGGTGTGKTHLAIAVARSCIRDGPRNRFFNVVDLVNWLETEVESRCGAVALGRTYLLPPLSTGGASMVPPWLRFHIPLIEPDRQISRIRLSRLHAFACNAICSS